MLLFEGLLTASARVVKDFISYIYSRLKSVYYSLKRWLWTLQGKFQPHDAFVAMVYGYMDDVEDFEVPLALEYEATERELKEAQDELNRLEGKLRFTSFNPWVNLMKKTFTREAAPEPFWPVPSRPDCADPCISSPLIEDEEEVSGPEPEPIFFQQKLDERHCMEARMDVLNSEVKFDNVKERIQIVYQEVRGARPFGKIFNTMHQRMKHVGKCLRRRSEAAARSVELEKRVSAKTDIADFHSLCEVEEVETGEFHPVKQDADGEDLPRLPKIEVVRRIKDDCHRSAATWIREYVRCKNSQLSADEVSHATITRYVEQFCEKNKMDMDSRVFLMQRALLMVPIPKPIDIDIAMTVHSPAARELRSIVDTAASSVFLNGLCRVPGFESPFTILGYPGIVIRDGARPRKTSSYISYVSQVALGLNYQVPNPSLHNALVAVERRVFTVGKGDKIELPPQPKHHIFDRLAYFAEGVIRHSGYCKTHTPLELAMSYESGKRSLYLKAVRSLQSSPVNANDAKVTAFLKMEKHLMCKPIAPRLICPRSKRYNVELGRRLKFNEKRIMRAIDAMFESPTILSGYDSFRVGRIVAAKWGKFRDPVAIGVDASRFDQHVSRQALKFEHSVYNGIFCDPILKKLLKWQLRNDVVLFVEDKMLQFTIDRMRMSGDINTSMGNKIIMTGLMHLYFRDLGVQAELCNNGDDCVIICEKKDQSKFDNLAAWFLDFGFSMAIEEPVYELEKLEFCQGHPLCINGSYRMVRKPESMSKDAHSMLSMKHHEDVKTFLSATAQCGLVLNSGVPILEAFHRCLYRTSGYKKVSEGLIKKVISYGQDERLGGRRAIREEPVTMGNRMSFWKAYGVDPKTQVLVERYFDNLKVNIELRGVKNLTPLLQSILVGVPDFPDFSQI
nr:RNA-dependent RNA polymerase P1-P2 fusion protein [Rose spring dwarf-associated virus]